MQTPTALAQSLPRIAAGSDLLIAVLLTLALALLHAWTGFATLADSRPDNDSYLRLVQIRDLLAGQSWFDMQMYRMGPEGGFPLHWSRLVDLPLALMIATGQSLGLAAATAENLARTVWPLTLFGAAIFFIMLTARRIGGDPAVLPATVLGAAALYFGGQFAPGAIDHHNVQLVLVLAMLAALVDPVRASGSGAIAGSSAALTLAIGMEAAPYAATAGIAAAVAFIVRGRREAGFAAGFGAAFSIVTAATFVALVHPSAWSEASCDALSWLQLAVAMLGGLGLAAIAQTQSINATVWWRCTALATLGVATLALILVAFPECLSSPFGELDPRLRIYWLDHVSEARSVLALASREPNLVFAYYATPLLGVLAIGMRMVRNGSALGEATLAGLLLVALLVSAWQVRGATFSLPLAAIALAIWLAPLRIWLARSPSRLAPIALVAAWIGCFNASWGLAAGFAFPAAPANAEPAPRCHDGATYAELAALPAGTVLAPSDLGAPIVLYTGHRVLSGPYHRNQAGMIATLDALMGPTETAETVVRAHGVSFVVLCRGLPEIGLLTRHAPEGFLASLGAGAIPPWLQPIGGDDRLTIFEVR